MKSECAAGSMVHVQIEVEGMCENCEGYLRVLIDDYVAAAIAAFADESGLEMVSQMPEAKGRH